MHHMQVLSPDFSRYLSHSITILPDAQGQNDAHAACAFETSQHVICVFGIPEYVLFCRLQDGATTRSTQTWFQSVV